MTPGASPATRNQNDRLFRFWFFYHNLATATNANMERTVANKKTAKKRKAAARRKPDVAGDVQRDGENTVTPSHNQTRGEDWHNPAGDNQGVNVAREQEYAGEHGTVVSR